jgi:hypothetical protein
MTLTEEVPQARSGYPLGVILHVKSRGVLGNKSYAALHTHKGWRRVNDYNVIGKAKEVKGIIGTSLDISRMRIVSQLHAGLAEDGRIGNIFHLAALPPGATVKDPNGRVFTKTNNDKFQIADGKVIDYHYFSPNNVIYKAQLPKEEE